MELAIPPPFLTPCPSVLISPAVSFLFPRFSVLFTLLPHFVSVCVCVYTTTFLFPRFSLSLALIILPRNIAVSHSHFFPPLPDLPEMFLFPMYMKADKKNCLFFKFFLLFCKDKLLKNCYYNLYIYTFLSPCVYSSLDRPFLRRLYR